MENSNGVSSTSNDNISSGSSKKKASLARGLRNFRMDKESATKGQLSLLRFFRSEPKKSLGNNQNTESVKSEDSEDADSTRPTSPDSVKSEERSVGESVERGKANLTTTTLVNKPSSTVSYRHTVVESLAEGDRKNSSQSSGTESENVTTCTQQGLQEPTSPIFKRKERETNVNGSAEGLSDSCDIISSENKMANKKSPFSLSSFRKSSMLLFVPPQISDTESSSGKEGSPKNPLGGVSMKLLIGSSPLRKSLSCTDTEQDSQDSPVLQPRGAKRARVIESDEESEELNPPSKKTLVNGHSSQSEEDDDDIPDDETIDKYIDMWVAVYPHVDRMECLDAFKEHKWEVKNTMLYLGKLNTERKSQSKLKNLEDMMAKRKEIAEKKKKEQSIKKKESVEKREELRKQRESVKQMESSERAAQREKLKAQKAVLKAKAAMKREDQDMEEEEDEYNFASSKVYESDEDSDVEQDTSLTPDRSLVLQFFNEANSGELAAMRGCNKVKSEAVIQNRPYSDWNDIVAKFQKVKSITPELLNQAKTILHIRNTVQQLMKRCEKIAKDMQSIVSRIVSGEEDAGISEQPESLNPSMQLKGYQLIGLNWLVLMHEQGLNGVLADEMGLGKTVQAISFLAHIKEVDDPENISLIIVPSSTLENWARELELWCPSLVVLQYHGSQDERRGMRIAIINNDLEEDPDVILTTYNMVTSSAEDRALFKKIRFNIVILDEAHMLKNMASQRYEQLMKIKGERRLLLTGTPLQNNLVELMSILIFVMPQLFDSKRDELKRVFSLFPKGDGDDDSKSRFERERIEQAKRIMKPFFLRRLKIDVLKDLPPKRDRIIFAPMSEQQQKIYSDVVSVLSKKAQQNQIKLEEINLKSLTEVEELETSVDFSRKKSKEVNIGTQDTNSNMVMTLRKMANHPLLIRTHYDLDKIRQMAKALKKSTHRDSILEYIVEDLSVMSDYQIHKTCHMYYPIKTYSLSNEQILNSGKFQQLDVLLPKLKTEGARVLLFSQFVIVLDILENYLKIRHYKFIRIDGSTQVSDRQMLIDLFTDNEHIFIFLLSTRAGGLGINLTAANTVILHDIDFNPYNDKQAEDRCHRVGQTKPVEVIRLVCKDSIEEGMLQIAQNKLQLERDVTGQGEEQHKKGDLVSLLKAALGLGKVEGSSSTTVSDGQHNKSEENVEEATVMEEEEENDEDDDSENDDGEDDDREDDDEDENEDENEEDNDEDDDDEEEIEVP